jgi:chaperonin GroEL
MAQRPLRSGREKVVFRQEARALLKRGADQMAWVLRATLGPTARVVAIEKLTSRAEAPEILDDGATIARRIIEIPNRYVNMGAMLIRHLAWKQHEAVGDGTATAAVLAHAVLSEATRYIAAGGNPMLLKRGVEKALHVALEELKALSTPLETADQVAALATAATGDPEMGGYIGEMFDIVGRDGYIQVMESPSTKTDREYVEGVIWDRGYLSPYMVTDPERMEAVLDDALVLVTDHIIKRASELIPVMEKVHQAGFKNFFIVANDIESEPLSLLVANKQQGVLTTLAVKAPGYGDRRIRILEDLAIITGGRPFLDDAGDRLEEARLEDLGRAQRVWANRDYFSIIGGYGDPARIRQRIAMIKSELPTVTDDYEREKMRERLGKLAGGVAILRVGAATKTELEEKKNRAERAVALIRAAVEEGVVPGGGAAYLALIPALERIAAQGDEKVGVRILQRALEEPLRAIVENAGYESDPIIAELQTRPRGWGFDVLRGTFVDMREAGILDATKVLRLALEKGVSGAIMAFTTEALVLRNLEYDLNLNP